MEVMPLNFGTDGFDLEATLEVMPLSLGSDSVEFWRWCRWVLEVTMEVMVLPFGSCNRMMYESSKTGPKSPCRKIGHVTRLWQLLLTSFKTMSHSFFAIRIHGISVTYVWYTDQRIRYPFFDMRVCTSLFNKTHSQVCNWIIYIFVGTSSVWFAVSVSVDSLHAVFVVRMHSRFFDWFWTKLAYEFLFRASCALALMRSELLPAFWNRFHNNWSSDFTVNKPARVCSILILLLLWLSATHPRV